MTIFPEPSRKTQKVLQEWAFVQLRTPIHLKPCFANDSSFPPRFPKPKIGIIGFLLGEGEILSTEKKRFSVVSTVNLYWSSCSLSTLSSLDSRLTILRWLDWVKVNFVGSSNSFCPIVSMLFLSKLMASSRLRPAALEFASSTGRIRQEVKK